MQSRSTKTFQVQQPIEQVWRFLSDPRKVAPCLPGAQITEAVDDRTFKGTITVKIGPVSTQFKGEVKLERLDQQNYEMELAGMGQDPRGGGGATMRMTGKLQSLPAGGTEVTGTTDVAVTGRLAQFGARMMDDVSNQLFAQFTKAFQARLEEEATAAAPDPVPDPTPAPAPDPEPIKAIPLILNVIKNVIVRFFEKLFGKSAA